jgi:hypothetical protein
MSQAGFVDYGLANIDWLYEPNPTGPEKASTRMELLYAVKMRCHTHGWTW